MRRQVTRLLACLLCAFPVAFAATAAEGDVQAAEGLKPMAFLAGHCWKGDFPDQKQNDEHCFQWIYAGKALRDTHTVTRPVDRITSARPCTTGIPDPSGSSISTSRISAASVGAPWKACRARWSFRRRSMLPTASR